MTPLWVAQVSLSDKMDLNETDLPFQPGPPRQDLASIVSLSENLNLYYVPFLLTTGLSLHITCCIGYTKTKLYKRFFTQLFLAVSVADIGFLLTLLLIWLNDLKIDIYAAPGMCPMVIFMSHFFPFMSFWHSIIAAVFLVLQPHLFKANKFARGHGRGKIVVICFSVFTFTIYLYKTWTNGVLKIGDTRFCTVLQETRDAMNVLNKFDMLFLTLLPLVGFIVYNGIMLFRLTNIKCPCIKAEVPALKVTKDAARVVAAHSVAFILLVGPGCLSKVFLMFKGGPGEGATNIKDLLLENLFQYLFYTYFALTPILQIIVSSSFRNHLCATFFSNKPARVNGHVEHTYTEERNSDQTLL